MILGHWLFIMIIIFFHEFIIVFMIMILCHWLMIMLPLHSSARSARCQVSHSPNHCAPIIITSTYICITKFTKTLPYSWSSKDHPYDRAFETETEWIYVESVILVVETETRPQPRGHWHRSVATAPELWCTVTHFPEMTRDLIFLTTELISSMMTNGNNDKDDEYECVRWESHVVPRATKA